MCQKILWPALTKPSSQHADFLSLPTRIFSTEGALRLPTTIDNHPSHPSIRPSVTKPPIHLKWPWIDLSRPPMTSNYLKWLTDWLLLTNRVQLCGRVPILMIYQGHQDFPPESFINKPNQIAFSHCCMVVIRFHFLFQSSEFYWPLGLVLW